MRVFRLFSSPDRDRKLVSWRHLRRAFHRRLLLPWATSCRTGSPRSCRRSESARRSAPRNAGHCSESPRRRTLRRAGPQAITPDIRGPAPLPRNGSIPAPSLIQLPSAITMQADGPAAPNFHALPDLYHGGRQPKGGLSVKKTADENSMLDFAYRAGPHRTELDRQRAKSTVDRSSFTRFRLVRTAGEWEGLDLAGQLFASSAR